MLVALSLLVLSEPPHSGAIPIDENSARDLIYALEHPPKSAFRGFFTCGSLGTGREVGRKVAVGLLKLGPKALPEIEKKLDSIRRDGYPPAGWLTLVYATLKGRDAYPRLRGMMDNRQFGPFQFNLGVAAAMSLGLTSYVDGSREGDMRNDHSCRADDSDTTSFQQTERPKKT